MRSVIEIDKLIKEAEKRGDEKEVKELKKERLHSDLNMRKRWEELMR
ncbi:MAG: hypothetical protein FWH29_03795 [Methanobrevibacter sp.]|nr:hypothetical protein [Methanobrevibacter sp.]